jgi:uncharacterized membrane protein
MAGAGTELLLVALAAMVSPTTLTFSLFVLVLAERPLRSGLWFYLGAFTATIAVGVAAAFVLGDAATASASGTRQWVAVFDVIAGSLLVLYVARRARRPRDPMQEQRMIEKMRAVTSSSIVGIFGAGAALANPGAFIPIALKAISQLDPSASMYLGLWTAFTVIALLPLAAAVLLLLVAPGLANRVLTVARGWLERHARTVGLALVLTLAAALIRNGVAGLS